MIKGLHEVDAVIKLGFLNHKVYIYIYIYMSILVTVVLIL